MRWIPAICLAGCLLGPPAADADVIRVVLLGTGGPRPDPARAGAALLVEANGQRLLFDSGRMVVTRLWQAGYPPADVSQVFLTHLHSDHVTGLPDLWLTGRIWQRDAALQVVGPAGSAAHVAGLRDAYRGDLLARRDRLTDLASARQSIVGSDVEPGVVYTNDGVRVTAFAVDHGHVRPAFGYRVDYAGRSVVISGDTRPSPNLVEQARGADLLVHEVAAAAPRLLRRHPGVQKILDYHTTPAQLADVLRESRPRLALLTHLVLAGIDADAALEQLQAGYDGRVVLGQDLMWVDVGERITLRAPGASARAEGAAAAAR